MKQVYSTLKSFVVALVCFLPVFAGAQLNVNSGASGTDLANAILGSGVSVSNVQLHCHESASGIFTNGGSTNIGLGSGILLTTGLASDAIGPNDAGNTSHNQSSAFNGDADLDNLVSGSIEDLCRLEFDFVAEDQFITVQYVFGSEEYNEYVCSQFNDVFGFFVTGNKPGGGSYNGENVALVPSTTLPVSVNTINLGLPGAQGSFSNCVALDNTEYYVDNASGVTIQYDGFTVVLTAQVEVIPGETYHFKFAIADVADSQLDSGVFIRSNSFSIFNCQAGVIDFAPDAAQEFCSNDAIEDLLQVVTNSTATGDEYAFLLTDLDGNILAISNDGSFALGAYADGNYLVYGISYDGDVAGIEEGENISDISAGEGDGCYDLSLPLPVRIETCTNFELIACAPEVTVECGSDLEDYDITGMPQISTNAEEGEVTFTHVDVIIASSDCNYVISRTWTISCGELTLSCVQIINVADTQGPELSGIESPISVQCIEDIPGFADVTAYDACSGAAEVENFSSQTGEIETECELSTAFGPGADWAVWLPVLSSGGVTSSANFVFDANGGHFDQFVDGTAHLYGTVVNTLNANEIFVVDLWFNNKADWATWSGLGRNYKNDLGLACATAGHINWDYYEMVGGFSTLTGAGDLAGDVLYLYHMPADYYFGFQVGTGANNKNCNFGLSGWFTYDGFVDGETIEGHGDVNVDAGCEPRIDNDCIHNTSFTYFYRAEDACGHATIGSQEIIVNDNTGPEFTNCPQSITIECSDDIPAVAEGVAAVDNCSGEVVVNYLGEIAQGDACYSTLTRTWEAIDVCGNRSNCVQTITIVDTTAPVLNGLPSEEITVECDAVPAAAVVTATDNCQEVVEVMPSSSIEPGNCPGYYTITRSWYAADSCGNDVSFTQTIHVEDTTAPVFDEYEFYTHIECDEIPALITATDNCGSATVEVIYEILNSGGCLGVYHRIYRATDECGNTAEAEQYIAIQDNTAPEIVGVPADATIECSEVSVGEDGNYFGVDGVYGVDNCELEVNIEYSEEVVETDDNCPQSFDIIRTWVATDYCDNQSTASQTVHVVDTTAPSLEIPSGYEASCDEELYYGEAVAWDNCGEVSISVDVDTIEGNCPNNYEIHRTFVATDECGNASEPQTQVIIVIDWYAPVFEEAQSSYTYECDEEVEVIQPVAYDNCSEVITYDYEDIEFWGDNCYNGFTRVWSATDECFNVSFFYQYIYIQDTTAPVISGELAIELPCDDYEGVYVTAVDNCDNGVNFDYFDEDASGSCAGKIIRHYTASDDCDNQSETFIQIITLIDNVDPVIVTETADFQVECGNEYAVQIPTFSDNCDDELDIVPSFSSEFDGCSTVETYSWTATDHCNNFVVSTTVVTIVDTQNPWFENFPADVEVSCEDELPAVVYPNAYDLCDDDVEIELSLEYGQGSCPQEQYIYRVFRGYDNCGNQVVETQTIHVFDYTAPVFGEQNDTFYYECDEDVAVVEPSATDNCGEVEMTYVDTLYFGDDCYSGFYRIWTATDECNNAASFYQYIYIQDTTAPVVDAFEVEISMPCDDINEAVLITATDNCNDVVITYSDEHVSGGCAGRIIRTYTVRDECYNYTEGIIQQIITLIDNVAPVGNEPQDITVACDEEVPSFDPQFSDNCAEELVLSHSMPIAAGYCNVSVTETWTATDGCGNTTTIDRVITFVDNVDPWFTYVPQNATYECTEEVIYELAEATDNCDLDVEVTVEQEIVEGPCAATYQIVRTFTATDECDNTAVAVQTIYVQDTVAPSFFEDNASQFSYECNTVAPVIEPAAYDACSTFELSYEDVNEWNEGCYYGFSRVWTALDACGNSSTFTQYINFSDTTAPVVDPFEIEIEMPCDNISDAVLITATDNCNDVVITFIDELVSGGCAGEIIRTYTVRDACFNYAEGIYQQFITLVDETAPVIVNAPENLTVECGDEIPAYAPVWTDNCDDELSVNAVSGIAFDGCNQIISQIYTAEDACGNETAVTRVITIVDTTDPYFTSLPQDEYRDCGDEDYVAEVSASDICDDEVVITHNDEIVAGDCPAEYTIERTFRATDDCGNQAVHVQYIYVSDSTAPVFNEDQATNFTYECGSEADLIQPVATDDCSTIEYSHVDGETWVDGCESGFTRTWYATDACGNISLGFEQYINFEDTTEPVLEGCPADLVLACDDEIPAPAEVTVSDVCDENVVVDYEQYILGDMPAQGSIADCDLITPVRPANNPCVYPYDWAMALFAMPQAHRWYSVSEGNLVQYPNGSIHVTATMNNVLNPSNGWFVDVWFQGGMDWAAWSSQSFPTGFKADCGGEAVNHEEWLYFLLQAGEGAELTGFGGYAGSSLNLVHAPANNYFGFQLGDGANNYNGADNGFGGWFSYNGTFRPSNTAQFTNVSGAGDFAFELDCCPDYWIVRQWTATDCSGNTVTCSQTITFEGTVIIDAPSVTEQPSVEASKETATVTVAPNPANDNTMFTFTALYAEKTTLEIFDMTGSKVADVFMGVVEAGVEYKVNYNVKALATGIYTFRLTNGHDVQVDRLIINK
jgi:hypothetical protein